MSSAKVTKYVLCSEFCTQLGDDVVLPGILVVELVDDLDTVAGVFGNDFRTIALVDHHRDERASCRVPGYFLV